jgi:DNA-binding MarR family transcriptional regulator
MRRKVAKHEVTRFLDAWFAVRQFIQASNFNRFQGAGLSATQFMALNLLPPNSDGIAIGDLARRMNLKPATVAKTVDSLEARRMIVRSRGEADKRMVFVRITKAGLELQNAASSAFREQLAEFLTAMPEDQRDGLIRGLESLSLAMGRNAARNHSVVNPVSGDAVRGARN